MTRPGQFVRNPARVEAVLFTESTASSVVQWVDDSSPTNGAGYVPAGEPHALRTWAERAASRVVADSRGFAPAFLVISRHMGMRTKRVDLGSWVVRDVDGEFYAYTADVFALLFAVAPAQTVAPRLFVGDEGISVPVSPAVRDAINDAIAEIGDAVTASALRRGVDLNVIALPQYERIVEASPLMRNPYPVKE